MPAFRQFSALMVVLVLCGCTAAPQNQQPAFQVPAGLSLTITPNDHNKQPKVFQADVLSYLVNARWSRESAAVLQQSHLSENAKYSALAIWAFQAVGGSDCRDLRLLRVAQVEASASSASPQSRAAELWDVDACGQAERIPVSE
jgi:hypothetical protein